MFWPVFTKVKSFLTNLHLWIREAPFPGLARYPGTLARLGYYTIRYKG